MDYMIGDRTYEVYLLNVVYAVILIGFVSD